MDIAAFIISILSLAGAIFAIVVSILSWHKNRAIYGIERTTLRQVRGRADDVVVEKRIAEISKKLSTGNYSIIAINTREADGDFEIILGKIKK